MTAAPPERVATPAELRRLLRHRTVGAGWVAGRGLEIGALHYPFAVPAGCTVEYLDVEDGASLRDVFPELPGAAIVGPTHRGDVVRATVPAITGRRFDFVVMNHVLEHVANPIQAIANVWAGVVGGGHLVLAVPDKRHTFDRDRALTSWEHLLAEYVHGVTDVDAAHYADFVAATTPEAIGDPARWDEALARARRRREHAHVWDSTSFRAFWDRTAALLGLDARVVYESTATANRFEYFVVIRRAGGHVARGDEALRVLAAVYEARTDLRDAFPPSAPESPVRLVQWATTAGATVDSDAPALVPFQARYRGLLARAGELERTLRPLLDAGGLRAGAAS
jgi:SAM-dependent methyltransferase